MIYQLTSGDTILGILGLVFISSDLGKRGYCHLTGIYTLEVPES